MRLFVALEIPETLRVALDRRLAARRGQLPEARWMKPESMHLTLSFLGEIDPQLLGELHHELDAVFAAGTPLGLRFQAAGAFPPRGKARVLWVGLAGEDEAASEALAVLHSGVARAVHKAASVEPETRPFHPHVTLARCRQPWARGAVERFGEALGELPNEAFVVREGTLFESELRPSGAAHRVVGTYPLGGAS